MGQPEPLRLFPGFSLRIHSHVLVSYFYGNATNGGSRKWIFCARCHKSECECECVWAAVARHVTVRGCRRINIKLKIIHHQDLGSCGRMLLVVWENVTPSCATWLGGAQWVSLLSPMLIYGGVCVCVCWRNLSSRNCYIRESDRKRRIFTGTVIKL